jgi:glycine/D-amino acid oxidase-like deaminating enzyme
MEAEDRSDYGTMWYAAAVPLPPARPPLAYDLDVDVCVIGGGLAGITAAREVARRGWSVAVLEARRIAWNASGRNSGVVRPGFSAPVEKIAERIGLPLTRVLWDLSRTGVQYIRDAIAGIGDMGLVEGNGLIEGSGCLDVAKWPDADRFLARAALMADMGTEVEAWPVEQVRDTLRTRHYFDALHFPGGFQINPLAYAHGLAGAAAQAGVRIFENTPVTAADLAGVRKRIDTPRARVRAGHVVLAGNIYLGDIARPLADTLIPATVFTGVTQPLGRRLALALAFGGAVSASRHGHHYRIVGGDRLMWTGSAGSLWARRSLARTIRATYPQLGPVQFEHFWPARTGFAVHGMPQIGEVERGVWLASAFGGHGLNTSAMAGGLIARAIVERDDTWKRFLPFVRGWAGGRAGRAVAGATAWWQRRSDAALALAARRREALDRRRELKASGEAGLKRRPAVGIPVLGALFGSGQKARDALMRRLEGSLAADDRPIDAPEAMPATGGDADDAKRSPQGG